MVSCQLPRLVVQMEMSSLLTLDAIDRAIGDFLVGLPVQRHPDGEAARPIASSNDLNAAHGLAPGPLSNGLHALFSESPIVECAPGAGQVEVSDLTGVLGFRKMKAMARQQRSHSIEFKRQVVQEYIAGETLYGLAKRHDLSRQLIRVWVEKYEAGGLDADAQAADLLHEYETKIVALERMVGRQALEIEFLKGALKNAPRPRSATTSVIAGPTVSPSQKDAG